MEPNVTGKVLGSLVLAVVGLVVYLSVYVLPILGIALPQLLFWYGLGGTFLGLILVVVISLAGEDDFAA